MAAIVSLDGQKIKEPTNLEISRFNLTKSGRTAKGKMVMDFIAKKRKFQFSYDILQGRDLKTILDIIDTEKMFFPIVYLDDFGTQKGATVYVGEISQKKFRTEKNGWYWKDITFDLIEQ